MRTSSGLLRRCSELPRFTKQGDLLTKWKSVYPLKKNAVVLSCYMWLVVDLLPLVFSALILYVLNVACNCVLNSGENNEHHLVYFYIYF
jgi:hypothetical protein